MRKIVVLPAVTYTDEERDRRLQEVRLLFPFERRRIKWAAKRVRTLQGDDRDLVGGVYWVFLAIWAFVGSLFGAATAVADAMFAPAKLVVPLVVVFVLCELIAATYFVRARRALVRHLNESSRA